MELVRVYIPSEQQLFTIYADGNLVCIEGDEDSGYNLEFKANQMIALFYHSKFHRRCYITFSPDCIHEWKFPSYNFYLVDQQRVSVSMLQGRAFDRFKRSLEIVKKQVANCYRLPPLFWIRFAYLAQQGRNSIENIERLINVFGGENEL